MRIDISQHDIIEANAQARPTPRIAAASSIASFVWSAIAFCLLELVGAWGWLHWRADLATIAPSPLATMAMRSAFLLLFITVIVRTHVQAEQSCKDARDAASFGIAGLLMHLPWTLIVMRWPIFAGLWLLAIAALTILATARYARFDMRAGLVAAPYTAWMIAAFIAQCVSIDPQA